MSEELQEWRKSLKRESPRHYGCIDVSTGGRADVLVDNLGRVRDSKGETAPGIAGFLLGPGLSRRKYPSMAYTRGYAYAIADAYQDIVGTGLFRNVPDAMCCRQRNP